MRSVKPKRFWAGKSCTLTVALSGRSVIEDRPEQRLTMTVEEAAVILGISRATAYDAVSRGEIPCLRIGRRILIPKVAMERLLNGGSA